ncbi:MAG TPA: twin-arginine translocase TatA/TatE family subunit [Bacteroidales bacterium]|jgi:sec-independent protein translocase protein TatA|nr:twin-arginine translocase TatA/TatE family subunit [Bacteroidales bacterium]|tara:strand:- start:281 stop:553 length:273 start_codon:yes stop_codon:yes gene_type:complete
MIQHCGWIGGPEIIIILIVVILLFGGKKIPELARGLRKGIRDFKKATEDSGIKNDIKDVTSEIHDLKSGVNKINPKNILKTDNLQKPKKK